MIEKCPYISIFPKPLKVLLILHLKCREIMLSAVDTHCPVWMPCETVNTSLTGISCYCQHRQAFVSIDSLLVISTPKHPLMIQRALYYSVGKPDLAELSGACSKQAKKERRPMHSATSAMRRGKFVAHSLAASLSSGFQSLLGLDRKYNHLGADTQYAFFSFRYRMTHLVS